MAFCPVCDNDTLSVGNIYTNESETVEACYDECPYCGYYNEYDCDEEENSLSIEEMAAEAHREYLAGELTDIDEE